jgi:ELWxxDGT repeat protein
MKTKLYSILIILVITFKCYTQQYTPIDISTGIEGSRPTNFTEFNNLLIFSASDGSGYWPRKIFRSDGTISGTYALNDSISVLSNNYDLVDSAFVKLGKYIYFIGRHSSKSNKSSLWRTDGTLSGTTMILDSSTSNLVVLNQKLFFLTSYSDPVWGTSVTKLCNYDPTNSLTSEIYTWNNPQFSGYNSLRVFNDKIFFYNWVSDGTSDGTIPNTFQTNVIKPSEYSCVYNGLIYYRGNNGKLWRTDGTTNGTFQAVDYPVWSNLKVYNNLIYFSGGIVGPGMQGTELCSTDGTLANTKVVKDIYYGAGSSNPSNFRIMNGTLYFVANDGVLGKEIYKTDGTTNGTVLLKDIEPGSEGAFNNVPNDYFNIISHKNELFFNVLPSYSSYNTNTRASGIWKTDGTTNNTTNVFQIDTTRSLTSINGKLFFAGYSANTGWELYVEDLTLNTLENDKLNFSVFPNPFNTSINIKCEPKIIGLTYKVYDNTGRVLIKDKINSENIIIELNNLTNGIYLLCIDGSLQKIIKE